MTNSTWCHEDTAVVVPALIRWRWAEPPACLDPQQEQPESPLSPAAWPPGRTDSQGDCFESLVGCCVELQGPAPSAEGWAEWWPGWGGALVGSDEPRSGSAELLGWTESEGCASGPPWDSASPM